MSRPRTSHGSTERELDRVEEQISSYEEKINSLEPASLTTDKPIETAPQTQISKKQIEMTDAPWIRPSKTFSSRAKPLPQLEADRKRAWEYVKVIAENKEIQGEMIEFWLLKFPGDSHCYWQVPVNRPIYVPRMVAEHLASRNYTRWRMRDPNSDEVPDPTNPQNTVKEVHRRIDCRLAGLNF